jgi:succinoglycan biosynthesis protein ExoM
MKDQISICICTYRRNKMLEQLLRKIMYQDTFGYFDYSVVVVDNDATGHAQETVSCLGQELGIDITYGIEPVRTIPTARNHAVRLARGNYIAIIDDDEFPTPNWLLNLYNGIQTFGADGALGPVFPFFEKKPPSWLIKGGFCERPVHRTGTILQWHETRTGNVLLKKAVFDRYNLSFDPNFKTGGSDQQFFREAINHGCKFVAVEEAPVYEIVPPERWTKTYYLKRAIINGYNAHKYNAGGDQITLAGKSFFALLVYSLILPFSFIVGTHEVMKYAEKAVHHLSRLVAMLGVELHKRRDF